MWTFKVNSEQTVCYKSSEGEPNCSTVKWVLIPNDKAPHTPDTWPLEVYNRGDAEVLRARLHKQYGSQLTVIVNGEELEDPGQKIN